MDAHELRRGERHLWASEVLVLLAFIAVTTIGPLLHLGLGLPTLLAGTATLVATALLVWGAVTEYRRAPAALRNALPRLRFAGSGGGLGRTSIGPALVVPPSHHPVHVRRNEPCPCGSGLKFKVCLRRRNRMHRRWEHAGSPGLYE